MEAEVKGSIGRKTSRNSWMGYAVKTPVETDAMPVDVVPYLLWADTYSSEHSVRHTVLVVDDIATHNGARLDEARIAGDRKKASIERIAGYYGLQNVDVQTMRQLPDAYPAMLEKVTDLAINDRDFMVSLHSIVPRNYRTANPSIEELGHVLGEAALTLCLNERGYQLKLGHKKEKPFDTRSLMMHNSHGKELGLQRTPPVMIYLPGGHTTDARNNDDVVPPYIVPQIERMITLEDSFPEVLDKMQRSTPTHQQWIRTILHETGQRQIPDEPHDLGKLLYETVIEPLQDKK